MRLAAPLLFWLAASAPAAAQACEASIYGKLGEIVVTLEDRKPDGAITVSWAVERKEGVGEESDHFSRPGLLLDFTMAGATGALSPSKSFVTVTRYTEPGLGKPPPLSEVRFRVKPKGGAEIIWPADDAARGEAELARQLKARWPDELVIDLLLAGDRLAASGVFDLSTLSAAQEAAHKAAADAAKPCSG